VFFNPLKVFLPLGAAYSVDQLRKPRKPPLARQHLSIATFGYCLQLVCFYFMAGWFKEQEPVWQSGQAVAEFTRIDNYVTGFGALLSQMPRLGRFLTNYTLILEEYGHAVKRGARRSWRISNGRATILIPSAGATSC